METHSFVGSGWECPVAHGPLSTSQWPLLDSRRTSWQVCHEEKVCSLADLQRVLAKNQSYCTPRQQAKPPHRLSLVGACTTWLLETRCWSKKPPVRCLSPLFFLLFSCHYFLKLSGSWNHEPGADPPCLAPWQGYPGLQCAGLSARPASFMPQRGGGHWEETSYLPIWCSSWFIYQTERFILKFRYSCWIEPLIIPLAKLQFQHLSLPVLAPEFTCCPPAQPRPHPCWASKGQGSWEGLEEGGIPAPPPHLNKEVKEASVLLQRQAWNAVSLSIYITHLGLSVKGFTFSNQLSMSLHDLFQDSWLSL